MRDSDSNTKANPNTTVADLVSRLFHRSVPSRPDLTPHFGEEARRDAQRRCGAWCGGAGRGNGGHRGAGGAWAQQVSQILPGPSGRDVVVDRRCGCSRWRWT